VVPFVAFVSQIATSVAGSENGSCAPRTCVTAASIATFTPIAIAIVATIRAERPGAVRAPRSP